MASRHTQHARSAGLAVTALLALRGLAYAQTAAPPGDAGVIACLAERREIVRLNAVSRDWESREVSCRQAREEDQTLCSARVERGASELRGVRGELESANNRTGACQTSRAELCSTTGELVASVLQLRNEVPAVESCVPPTSQRALTELLASWRNGRVTMQRLESFGRGETDALPTAPGPSRGEADALALRLSGSTREAPEVYRRLLVEAVRALAPRFWRALAAGGPHAVDVWFGSSEELDPAFLAEAQAALASHADDGATGPAQSAALRYVQTYADLVDCQDRARLPECLRAAQLAAFLESSSALIVRQRVREIWQLSCGELDPTVVLAWLREFPTSQPLLGNTEWGDVTRAAYDKLVACYLADAGPGTSQFHDWLTRRLPGPAQLTRRTLERLDRLRAHWEPEGSDARCLSAALALRVLPSATECALPERPRAALLNWFEQRPARAGETLSLGACRAYSEALWRGRDPHVLETFPGVPSPDELVRVGREGGFEPTVGLRARCLERTGALATFPENLRRVARIASAAGEDVTLAPWRLDGAGGQPRESGGVDDAMRFWPWARNTATGASACSVLNLRPARCAVCASGRGGAHYDCALVAQVEARWRWWQRLVSAAFATLVSLGIGLGWGVSLTRALRSLGAWRRELVAHLRSLGLAVDADPLRFLFPTSRMPVVRLDLPDGPWERWGKRLAVIRAENPQQITERDVKSAALAARGQEAELAIVTHDEGASPSLAAVRAMLDWAARGPRGAVQILPVSSERLRWARSTDDLLDLVEQVSLRGNPFEVRGRLVSSSQFFNRERLVSGLLAGAQAGAWTVITGLRRFGKSSLALEVARRLQAPYAYVDLAGFHHEVTSGGDPTRSVDAILRYVCRQLHASAEALYERRAQLPEPPAETTALDTDALTSWMRAFVVACRAVNRDKPVSALVIFDEVEQAIGVGAERVTHAIEVLSILVGRLRACLSDGQATHGGDRVGVLFCSAIHAALWAPLTTLGRQSLLGAFPSVSVPRLPEDAAFAMMRGLGARQGIRFTDQALALIVREAQGIPILVRRIGSSVLELYDPERARQGSLGAVEIGIEGALAAVRREEEDGAPLRVWVESEIGDLRSPVGALLRELARRGTVSIDELKARAAEAAGAQFEELGLARVFGPDEARRRAQEAAGFLVRMLHEIGLLVPEGDATSPHALTFPDSIVRRILAAESAESPLGF